MKTEMDAETVVAVLDAPEDASVRVWLGGWEGYEPTENDLRDMERLQERFGVVLPVGLCRQGSRS